MKILIVNDSWIGGDDALADYLAEKIGPLA
jgi:hypothetical protein